MSLSSLLLFIGVYAAAVATPGPGVAALVAAYRARKLFGSWRAMTMINRGAAGVMAGAAVAVAAR